MLLGVKREQDRVEAPVRPLADDVGGCPGVLTEPPRTTPRRHGAALKGTDDLVGNGLADVVLVWHDCSPPGWSWLVITTSSAVSVRSRSERRKSR